MTDCVACRGSSDQLQALEPHPGVHQVTTSGQPSPIEPVTPTVHSRIAAVATGTVPESSGVRGGTVVDVTVECREVAPIQQTHLVGVDVAREPGDGQLVPVGLIGHDERAVFSPVPEGRALLLHVHSQLASTVLRQLVDVLVAQPEVSTRTAKPNSEFIP